jgi:hypothetical protein
MLFFHPAIVSHLAGFVKKPESFSLRCTNTYITLNSLLLAAIAFLVKDTGANSVWKLLLPLPLLFAGVFVSIWWAQLIFKYKNLVGLRMDALFNMEKSDELSGLEKMYHIEAEKYYLRDESGNMLEDKIVSFSKLELRLPILFLILYLLFGILIFITYISL